MTHKDFDYSTPEAQQALKGVSELVLEIRDEFLDPVPTPAPIPADPRVRLYERSLGLAVIPVLVRRAFIRMRHRDDAK
ncbi:MAG: hypothetical protein U1E26_05845 [Coriobacteriia bacterium]|nr:hypothetical protein [Coriobacteriia bacterium]